MDVVSADVMELVNVYLRTPVPTARDARAPTNAQRTATSTWCVLSVPSRSSSRTP